MRRAGAYATRTAALASGARSREPTDPERLRGDLGLARARGYAPASDGVEEGRLSVAAPSGDRDGRAIAATSLASHRMRRSPADLRPAARQVRRAVESFGGRGRVP